VVRGDVVRLQWLGGAYFVGTLLHGPPVTFLGISQPKTNPSHPVSTGRRGWVPIVSCHCSKKVDNLERQKNDVSTQKRSTNSKGYLVYMVGPRAPQHELTVVDATECV